MDPSAPRTHRFEASQKACRYRVDGETRFTTGRAASVGAPGQSALKLKWTQEWIAAQFGAGVRQSTSPLGKHLDLDKSSRKKLFETIKTLHAGSFDSQESAHTHQSFCIGADHDHTEAASRDSIDAEKLLIAGVLELCTDMLHSLLLPPQMRRTQRTTHRAARARAATNGDVASLAVSLVAQVSAGLQSKAIQAVQHDVHERRGKVASRERQLRSLTHEASRVKRHPMVEQLTKEREELRNALVDASRDVFRRKVSIHECAIEVGRLRWIEQEASATLQSLRDCRVKYEHVSEDNCELNRTIQQLRGAVRVVCHIPTSTTGRYLEATNRRAVTYRGKKKNRSFNVDAVISGQPCPHDLHHILTPLATSALDGATPSLRSQGALFLGMDVLLLGMEHEESCFRAVMLHAIAALLSLVDDRFYHISCILDFEFSFISASERHCIVPNTRLSSVLGLKDDTRSEERLKRIEAWITDLFATKQRLCSDEQAHVVLKIILQTQQTPNAMTKTSSMTLIQMHPATAGRWLDDRESGSVASVLTELSANRWPSCRDTSHNALLAEMMHRNSEELKLYTLFLELHHAPEYEKRDLTALNFCAKLTASKAVAMDGKSIARQKMALRLNKEIEMKDEQITQLEQERRELLNQTVAVHSDIDRLRAEIEKLQAQRNAERPPTKQIRPTKLPRKPKALTKQRENVDSSKRGASSRTVGTRNGVRSSNYHHRATQAPPPGVPMTHRLCSITRDRLNNPHSKAQRQL